MSRFIDRSGTLLFDQDCGICLATAAWLERRVPASRLGLLPLRDAGDVPRIARVVAGRDLASTIHFVGADDRVMTGARAVLAAGRLVPRWRHLAAVFDHRLGHLLLEPVYRQVAAHRRFVGRILRLPAECPVPHRAQEPGGG